MRHPYRHGVHGDAHVHVEAPGGARVLVPQKARHLLDTGAVLDGPRGDAVAEDAWSHPLLAREARRFARGMKLSPQSLWNAAALAQSLAQVGVLNPHQLQNALLSNVGGMLTLQDDPHRLRVRQQVGDWQQGPPEGWVPPQAPVDSMTGQPMVDPMTSQPLPAPPDPVLTSIFAPLPVDEEPQVAAMRTYELGRAMAGGRFERFPPEWQAGLVQAYHASRQAAGQMTTMEQSQAQQQQAQQQQQVQAQTDTAQADLRERAANQREQMKTEREMAKAGMVAANAG